MASVSFPSLDRAEVIEVELISLDENSRSFRLLVDTGFSGRSSMILGKDASEFFRASLPASEVSGALTGPQERAWVTCRIQALQFQATVIAIIADLSKLRLPPGVAGMVGLTFLRNFAGWGARRIEATWRFHLHNEANAGPAP
jgi:hypothetical protein